MRISDIRCARIGRSPVLRILTDEGIDGFAEIEFSKPYVAATLGVYRPLLLGADPMEVERCKLRIRQHGRVHAVGRRRLGHRDRPVGRGGQGSRRPRTPVAGRQGA
ncbi:hypothetical protein [Streptomyces sp. NPDC059092]|uniref:hypothetical protein n=1 Tax=Streptomyces sp. NPDC059092 TaxID=3346725 RepID=UPI0036BA9841